MMFNNNSPIINNMMGNNGMYNNMYMPSNPIGNIGVGTNGYNNMYGNMGGYYNNQYNYYNPYLIQQQRQMQEAQLREQMRQQSDILKSISMKVNNALGLHQDDMEQHLEQYNPENFCNQNQYGGYNYAETKEAKHNRLVNIHFNAHVGDPRNTRMIEYNNRMYEEEKRKRPDSMGIIEFNKASIELCEEVVTKEMKKANRNLGRLYNADDYNKLVRMNSNSTNYFSSLFNGRGNMDNSNTNIDDMEVTLPSHLIKTYDERKRAFLDSILK